MFKSTFFTEHFRVTASGAYAKMSEKQTYLPFDTVKKWMIPKKVSLKEKKMVLVAELETGNILETLNNLISLRRFMSEVK